MNLWENKHEKWTIFFIFINEGRREITNKPEYLVWKQKTWRNLS